MGFRLISKYGGQCSKGLLTTTPLVGVPSQLQTAIQFIQQHLQSFQPNAMIVQNLVSISLAYTISVHACTHRDPPGCPTIHVFVFSLIKLWVIMQWQTHTVHAQQ